MNGIHTYVYGYYFLIGAYFAIDAACAIIAGVKLLPTTGAGWLLVAQGILRTIVLLAFFTLGAVGLLALMLIVGGIVEIVAAIQLRRVASGTLWYASAGVLSILFLPVGILSVAFLPFYLFIFGALILVFGLRMRGSARIAG